MKKHEFGQNPVSTIYGESHSVDWSTAKLHQYDNSTNTAIYTCQVSGDKHWWVDVAVNKKITDIDERLSTWNNPVKFRYALLVAKNDPDSKIWANIRQDIKENPEQYFTKNGNWRKRGLPEHLKSAQRILNWFENRKWE